MSSLSLSFSFLLAHSLALSLRHTLFLRSLLRHLHTSAQSIGEVKQLIVKTVLCPILGNLLLLQWYPRWGERVWEEVTKILRGLNFNIFFFVPIRENCSTFVIFQLFFQIQWSFSDLKLTWECWELDNTPIYKRGRCIKKFFFVCFLFSSRPVVEYVNLSESMNVS